MTVKTVCLVWEEHTDTRDFEEARIMLTRPSSDWFAKIMQVTLTF